MLRRIAFRGLAIPSLMLVAACSQSPQSPVSPSIGAGGDATANPDGSLLKVSAPAPVSPANGATVDNIRPTVSFRNSSGRFTSVALGYVVQVFDGAGTVIGELPVAQDPSGQTSLGAETDLGYDTEYRWRVRAAFQGEFGPWSETWSFRTAPRVALGTAGGSVGPPRDIGIGEAVNILEAIYNAGRWSIRGGPSRDQLNLYLEIAASALHYGHPRWNPRGPDVNWCIKNNGPGRPQSDEVIARCNTREAWDLITSLGGANAVWNPVYLGRLPGEQTIYAPRASVLSLLPQ